MKINTDDGISLTLFETHNKDEVATENQSDFEAENNTESATQSQDTSGIVEPDNGVGSNFAPDAVAAPTAELSSSMVSSPTAKPAPSINFAPSLKLEIHNLMPPSMSIPELIGMEPDSAEIDMSGTITRFWDCGYQHRQHQNGAEELIHDGATIRQIEAGHTSCDFWVQHEFSYQYEEGVVSSLTMKSLDGEHRINSYNVGDQADLDGPMNTITEINALTGKDAGYQIVFEDGRTFSVLLRGAARSENGQGTVKNTEILKEHEEAPDGKSFLPMGSRVTKTSMKSLPIITIEASLPDGFNKTYVNDGIKTEQTSEDFSKPKPFTVEIDGHSHTEKNISGWSKGENGSLTLYRQDKNEPSISHASVRLIADQSGKFTAVETVEFAGAGF